MYKAIRQLAEDAIIIQNKIAMESALKDIALMCAEAEIQTNEVDSSETQEPETKKGKK